MVSCHQLVNDVLDACAVDLLSEVDGITFAVMALKNSSAHLNIFSLYDSQLPRKGSPFLSFYPFLPCFYAVLRFFTPLPIYRICPVLVPLPYENN